jgi:hypothetical protein
LMDDYYRYRKEAITRDTRLTPRTLLRWEWEKKFINNRKIPPEEEDKKHSLWLKNVRWKHKENNTNRNKELEFMKGKYKFRIDTKRI